MHAHRWRRTFAREWKLNGGNDGDLMLLMGWTSGEMPRRYGQSAAAYSRLPFYRIAGPPRNHHRLTRQQDDPGSGHHRDR